MSEHIKMNRRDWIKSAFTKTKETSLKATSRAAGRLADVSDTLKEYRWETVANERDITDKPKQIMFEGKSVFILRVDEQLYAFQGICPEDQQLVFWRGNTKQFYCPSCGLVYNVDGDCVQEEELALTAYAVRLEKDQIQLRVD